MVTMCTISIIDNKKYIYDIIFFNTNFIFFTRQNIPGVAVGGCSADPEYSGRRRTRVNVKHYFLQLCIPYRDHTISVGRINRQIMCIKY